jgi:hypothetical protein
MVAVTALAGVNMTTNSRILQGGQTLYTMELRVQSTDYNASNSVIIMLSIAAFAALLSLVAF